LIAQPDPTVVEEMCYPFVAIEQLLAELTPEERHGSRTGVLRLLLRPVTLSLFPGWFSSLLCSRTVASSEHLPLHSA
jgi:hypothetical protein